MSHHLLEDLNNLYVEVNQYENNEDFNDIVETVFSDLVYSLASEGYSAKGIVSYLSHTSEQEIIEYYLNIGQIENKVSEEYAQEQINLINEGLGTFLRILGGGALRGGKMFGRGAVTAAKSTGSTLKAAVKSGFPQTSQKLSGAVSKIKGVVKSPAAKVGAATVALGGAYGLGRMQGGQQGLAKGPTAPTPPAAPAAPSGGGKGGAGPKGGGKPSAPGAASVDKQYRDLIKQGKTAEAEKFGLEAWKKANPKLAARLNPDGTQKGTGQSEMEKQADELRKLGQKLKTDMAPGTGPQAVSNLPGGNYSPQSTAQMSDRTKEILGTTNSQPKDEKDKIKKAGEMYGKKAFEDTRDAYSIVLDYLISEGHADTISEAHYVMMQMNAEHIQNIVENIQSGPILPTEKGKKVYPKGQEPKATGAELPKLPPA